MENQQRKPYKMELTNVVYPNITITKCITKSIADICVHCLTHIGTYLLPCGTCICKECLQSNSTDVKLQTDEFPSHFYYCSHCNSYHQISYTITLCNQNPFNDVNNCIFKIDETELHEIMNSYSSLFDKMNRILYTLETGFYYSPENDYANKPMFFDIINQLFKRIRKIKISQPEMMMDGVPVIALVNICTRFQEYDFLKQNLDVIDVNSIRMAILSLINNEYTELQRITKYRLKTRNGYMSDNEVKINVKNTYFNKIRRIKILTYMFNIHGKKLYDLLILNIERGQMSEEFIQFIKDVSEEI